MLGAGFARLADNWVWYSHGCEITAPGFAGIGRQAVHAFQVAYMEPFPDNSVVLTATVASSAHAAVDEGQAARRARQRADQLSFNFD